TRLDAAIAEAKRTRAVLLPGGRVPHSVPLPAPEAEGEPGIDLTGAASRARREIRENTVLARQVAHAQADSENAGDRRRLTAQLREVREQPAEVDLADYQAQVRRAGETIANLEKQLHALRPRPDTDRFFYTEAQLRHRIELFDTAQKQLAEL